MKAGMIKDVFELVRWRNLLIIVFFFLLFDHTFVTWLGTELQRSRTLATFDLYLLILDILLVAGVGYIWNDLYDLETDRINRPGRFLVRFPDSQGRVRAGTLVMVILGGLITFYLAYRYDKLLWMFLFPLSLLTLYAYARTGRQWEVYANVLVSLMIAAIPFVNLLAEFDLWTAFLSEFPDRGMLLVKAVVAFALMMFWTNLSRELVKDLQDQEGDRMGGKRTMPLVRGVKSTKGAAVAALGMLLILQGWFVVVSAFQAAIIAFATCVVVVSFHAGIKIVLAKHTTEYSFVSHELKLLMLVGMVEMLCIPSFI